MLAEKTDKEQCPVCRNYLKDLYRHMYRKHPDRLREFYPPKLEKTRPCPVCGKRVVNVHRHARNVHNKELPYTCWICGKSFDRSSSLGAHMKTVHYYPEHNKVISQRYHSQTTPEEYRSICDKAIEKRESWRSEVKLTEEQEALMLGGLLGKMSIGFSNSPLNPNSNARVYVRHCLEEYDYVMWKYSILENIVASEPKIVGRKHYGKVVEFYTFCLPSLTRLRNLVTVNGRRSVNRDWLSRINHPLSLAVWAMDVGSASDHEFTFHLGNTTFEKAGLLQEMLKDKWSVSAEVCGQGRKKLLMVKDEESLKRLKEWVEPYIVDSMKDKFLF